MNFELPQKPMSINGFPVSFRREFINEQEKYWVPRGISRNEVVKAWRIWFRHRTGEYTSYVHDKGRSKMESLKEAWQELKAAYASHDPYISADKRVRTPGPDTDPLLDLGYTGVHISRLKKPKNGRGSKTVVVYVHQNLVDPESKEKRSRQHHTARITMNRYEETPVEEQRRFEEGILKAIAIRRYHNKLHSECRPPGNPLKYEDVPSDIRQQPAPFPILDVGEILNSF